MSPCLTLGGAQNTTTLMTVRSTTQRTSH